MRRIFPFLANLKIRYKLLVGYTLAVLLSVVAGGVIIILVVEKTLEAHIESELTNATASMVSMVRTAASTSIKNHLRAVAEKNREIVARLYDDAVRGRMTEASAKALSRKILFSQTIGKTGYIFCASSRAVAIEHPVPEVDGRNFADREFVQKMILLKTGYLEYEWQNPDDHALKPKAMYMAYFEPWDWIIAASTYREEFRELIKGSDFKESISRLRFGKSGYAFIIGSKGNIVLHPYMVGNYYDVRGENNDAFAKKISDMKNGKIVYTWKNPGESRERKKMVIFNYIPEYDWIVASTSYLDEVFAPLNTIKTVITVIVLAICILVGLLSLWIDVSVARPLRALMKRFALGASGDFNLRMPVKSTDEIGQLAGYFNRFMDKLTLYSQDLKRQIVQREANEKALRLSEKMFSKAFRSSPAGMFITSLRSGKVINVNDSFIRITGFRLLDIIGTEMLSLSFFSPAKDGRALFDRVREGASVKHMEIRFLSRNRERRMGLISGERLDLWGEICILGAIEDITESRRLEQEILNASQREQRKIAMALHDDLGPQLIGIEVMTKMLQQRLERNPAVSEDEAAKAGRIRQLILDSIEKARTLSRGLSPVNLVDRGFDTSLSDLAAYIGNVFHIDCVIDLPDREPHGGHPPFDDNDVATHAYYIVHEAVHNAVKHARCSEIRICLTQTDGRTRLSVTDNGRGMAPSRDHKGLGHRIMSYRAGRIQAELAFEAATPCGTRVVLDLPCPVTPRKEATP